MKINALKSWALWIIVIEVMLSSVHGDLERSKVKWLYCVLSALMVAIQNYPISNYVIVIGKYLQIH